MKFSEQWLREWVNPKQDTAELAAGITMAGLEVDGISAVAGKFNNVVVAEVQEVKKHPQADKLSLCQVNNGSEILAVVCGAANVRAGLKVALAQIGTRMPSGMKIKESKLRGERSQGMLCSASELGLAETSEGILELPDDAPIGVDIREFLQLEDSVIDVDLTPNRADCFSVLGIAREVAAINFIVPPVLNPDSVRPTIDDTVKVRIEASSACTNYQCRVIRSIDVQQQSPLWLQERLRRSGLRSIHPIVDITNYVMLDIGQPMHAFDLNTIEGGICVRFAENKERITLLDDQEKVLNKNVLIIADDTRPLAMAGVMGGLDSAVTEDTVDILLESAWFEPTSISGIARAHGLCTDSSQRFERGVDPDIQRKAIEQATALILKICGGEAGPITGKMAEQHIKAREPILFRPSSVARLTGMALDSKRMLQYFEGLGLSVDKQKEVWSVGIPTWRFDLEREVDLVEEVIRLHGYDNISGSEMAAPVRSGHINDKEVLAQLMRSFFVSRGYHETISYSFVDPELQEAVYPEQTALNLLNPISTELSQMRLGLWPGLLASLIYNVHRQQHSLRLFETGVRFLNLPSGLQEEFVFSGLMAGVKAPYRWCEVEQKFDFFDAKGDLQALFKYLGMGEVFYKRVKHPALHPGQSATIEWHGKSVGLIGTIHPALKEALELTHDAVLFELSLDFLSHTELHQYQSISKFPAIRRDLSLLAAESVPVADIEALVRTVVGEALLKSFDVFDVYYGDKVPEGFKSLAISIEMQDLDKTLVDDEINNKISAILKLLEEKLSVTLRE